jgi:predicted MFS family arabinose efflux permease
LTENERPAGGPLPAAYWVLWTGTLVNRLGGMVFLFLPVYLTSRRGFSDALAGTTVALYGLGTTAAGPVGGLLAERLGRRRSIVAGLLLGAVALLQVGAARTALHIVVSAPLLGFLNELYRPALQASIADLVSPADRPRAYGYLYWAINLGFSGAAILAGHLADVSFGALFVIDAATNVIFAALVLAWVPETHPHGDRRRERGPGLFSPLRDPALLAFMAIQLLVLLAFNQFSLATLDMRAHGLTPGRVGTIMATNGIAIVLLQPLAVRTARLWAGPPRLALGAALTGLGFGMMALVHGPAGYVASIAVWTVGEIAFSMTVPVVLADMAPADARGLYQGAYQLTWGVAACAGPALGGAVLEHLGGGALWLGCLAAGLCAAALHLRVTPRLLANRAPRAQD